MVYQESRVYVSGSVGLRLNQGLLGEPIDIGPVPGIDRVYVGRPDSTSHTAPKPSCCAQQRPGRYPKARIRDPTAEDDPREKFRLYVRHIRHATEQWAPMRDVMRAAAGEPEVAEKLTAMEYGRCQGPENLWPAIEQKGQLREGLTAEEAAVLTYAICQS